MSQERPPLFDVMRLYFMKLQRPLWFLADAPVLYIWFQGHHGTWLCRAAVSEEESWFVCSSIWPLMIPEEKRFEMAQLITRINSKLVLGSFVIDLDSGLLHYKTSIDVEGDRLSEALISQLVSANILMLDHYWPAIAALSYADMSPQEALSKLQDAGRA